MDQEKIGRLIKEIRKRNNLTQKQLADKYGVTYQAVSKWENGKNIPDVSLLKQMSKDFNIEINDILEGEYTPVKKRKKYFIFGALVLVFFIVLLINSQNSFSFKTLSSKCASFKIQGSIAYNSSKSSIYISDIDYCGKEDKGKYSEVECTLYEKSEKGDKVISSNKYSDSSNPITLDEYLKNMNFKIDDYKSSCKKYTKDSLYLKIKVSFDNDNREYHVPLSLNDNC